MKSKPRLQKVFYLPLEYQIFFEPNNMSTAVFPYSIQCLKKVKTTTHFKGCNFYTVSNNSPIFLLRKSSPNQKSRNILNKITRLVQDINHSSILSKHFSVYEKGISFWKMDGSNLMDVQSIKSSFINKGKSKINEGASSSREINGDSGNNVIFVESVCKNGRTRSNECDFRIRKVDKSDVVFLQSVTKEDINHGNRKNKTVGSTLKNIDGIKGDAVIFVQSTNQNFKKKNNKSDFTIRHIDSNDVIFVENVSKRESSICTANNMEDDTDITFVESIKNNSTNVGGKRKGTESVTVDVSSINIAKRKCTTDHTITRDENIFSAGKGFEPVTIDDNFNNVEKRKNTELYEINDKCKVLNCEKTLDNDPHLEENIVLGNNQGSMPGQSWKNSNYNNPSSSNCTNLTFNFSHNLQLDGNSSNIDSNLGHTLGHDSQTNETNFDSESGPNEVKIMSYNILAQTLLRRHQNLYSHSDRKNLEWEVRLKNIINEILAYNCDIVCLQEVEESYLECLTSKLVDYKYVYKKRTGPNVDGCCTFYKHSKYALVKSKSVEYFISENHQVMNKHNIGLILCLRTAHHHNIIVANTHLLYNPRRSDVRYEQCKFLLRQIQHFHDSLPQNTPVVITGDFNSEPNAGLVNYILRNRSYFKWESAYDPKSHVVSTYHNYWCLKDYIFYTYETLKLIGQKVLPHHRKRPISRIPNVDEGSDHFSLVATFAFT